MGDLEMTDEDLKNIGEEPEVEEVAEESETLEAETEEGAPAEESETEQAAEEADSASDEPEEDAPVDNVQKRIDTLTYEREESNRKLDLLKRDPEEYYRLHPEERPEIPAAEDEKAASFSQAAGMRVAGGEYDGMTLKEVHDTDPFAAIDLYQNYRDSVSAEQKKVADDHAATQQSIDKEHDDFVEARSQELFKKPAGQMTEAESTQIHKLMMGYMDQMDKMKVYSLESMHKLASVDDRLNAGVESLIKSANKATVTHISAKKDGQHKNAGSSYATMTGWSEAQLEAHLLGMSPQAEQSFWEKAPDDLKAKFPGAAAAWV